nr:low affinity immunoglobulin epsilon Fc receptor isoform X2 [Pongo abelii]
MDFLTSTIQVTSWIGLFKDGQGSAHRWTDGSAPTYINWDSRKLDDNGTTPACVMMLYQRHWSNSSCKSEFPVYICEKRQSCSPRPLPHKIDVNLLLCILNLHPCPLWALNPQRQQ